MALRITTTDELDFPPCFRSAGAPSVRCASLGCHNMAIPPYYYCGGCIADQGREVSAVAIAERIPLELMAATSEDEERQWNDLYAGVRKADLKEFRARYPEAGGLGRRDDTRTVSERLWLGIYWLLPPAIGAALGVWLVFRFIGPWVASW